MSLSFLTLVPVVATLRKTKVLEREQKDQSIEEVTRPSSISTISNNTSKHVICWTCPSCSCENTVLCNLQLACDITNPWWKPGFQEQAAWVFDYQLFLMKYEPSLVSNWFKSDTFCILLVFSATTWGTNLRKEQNSLILYENPFNLKIM